MTKNDGNNSLSHTCICQDADSNKRKPPVYAGYRGVLAHKCGRGFESHSPTPDKGVLIIFSKK